MNNFNRLKFLAYLLFITSIAVCIGCGSGKENGGGIDPEEFGIYFEENCPIPESSSVSFQYISQGGDPATGALVVTDVDDVYAAAFHISYDSSLIDITCTEGDFLNSGKRETELFIYADIPGLLIIGISRKNIPDAIDAVGSMTLLNLTFHAKNKEGNSTILFNNQHLLNSGTPPWEIPDVNWCGGSINVRKISNSPKG